MKTFTLAVVGALLLTGSFLAHHSWGGSYDLQKQVLLRGRVVKMSYRNPHSTLTIETRNSGTWEGEWTSWDGLSRHGIREDTIKVGDFLEILGSPSRTPDSHVVAIYWEVRRPSDGWHWTSTEVWPGPRLIE